MAQLATNPAIPAAHNAPAALAAPLSPAVWMLDPFCFTPWYTAALGAALGAAGARVRLVCGTFSREPGYFTSLGLVPDPGPLRVSASLGSLPARLLRPVRAAETMLNTRALIRSIRHGAGPDVLHMQQTPLLNHAIRSDFALIEAAQQAGIPVVHTVHNLLPHDTGDRLRGAYAELYARVDHLVCHSGAAAQALATEFAARPERITVIPHGPLFAPTPLESRAQSQAMSRALLGLNRNCFVVLFQGVLAPYKGLDVLLEAWRHCLTGLGASAGSPLLLIAGAGPLELEVRARRAAEAMSANVRADIGYIPTSRLRDYYASADLLVYPYRSVTTSGALLTGLSYQKPIVASRLAPFEQYLVQGENARLVEPGNSAALAAALLPLLAGLQGEQAGGDYAQLDAGARGNAARYTGWAQIAEQTLALYRALTKRRT